MERHNLSTHKEILKRIEKRATTIKAIILSTKIPDTAIVMFKDGSQANVDLETEHKLTIDSCLWEINQPSPIVATSEKEALVLKRRVAKSNEEKRIYEAKRRQEKERKQSFLKPLVA
jgi:hypothetical protein